MATLAAGDVTTQIALYLNANAAGSDKNSKAKAAVATACGLAATVDHSTLWAKWIGR